MFKYTRQKYANSLLCSIRHGRKKEKKNNWMFVLFYIWLASLQSIAQIPAECLHLLDLDRFTLISFHFIHFERFIYLFISFRDWIPFKVPPSTRSKPRQRSAINKRMKLKMNHVDCFANPGANKTKTIEWKRQKWHFFFFFLDSMQKIYQISKRILCCCVFFSCMDC